MTALNSVLDDIGYLSAWVGPWISLSLSRTPQPRIQDVSKGVS